LTYLRIEPRLFDHLAAIPLTSTDGLLGASDHRLRDGFVNSARSRSLREPYSNRLK